MTKINAGKVLAGGILAGVLMNGIDYVSNNFIMAKDWQNVAQMRNIDITIMAGTPALVTSVAVDFVFGSEHVSLIWVILLSLAVGLVGGLLLAALERRRRLRSSQRREPGNTV